MLYNTLQGKQELQQNTSMRVQPNSGKQKPPTILRKNREKQRKTNGQDFTHARHFKGLNINKSECEVFVNRQFDTTTKYKINKCIEESTSRFKQTKIDINVA